MKRQIVRIGHPALTVRCEEVETFDGKLQQLTIDLLDTMYAANGLGLAAPQIAVPARVCVVDVTGEHPIVLVNPEIMDKDGTQDGEEGCLSIPGLRVSIRRPERIQVGYFTAEKEEKFLYAEGLLARAICHEMDHLNGKLITDYVMEAI